MEKEGAVASLGMASLLQPARVRGALKANDRLKLYLTLLQAAAEHAKSPQAPALDLMREISAAGVSERSEVKWLHELPATATVEDGQRICVPELPRLAERLQDDLATMARPLLDAGADEPALAERVQTWQSRLAALAAQPEPLLDGAGLAALTDAGRGHGSAEVDSLHRLVMDLHKALNRLAARLATDRIAGAHAWQLAQDGSDVPRIEAFMRGVDRTRALKGDHPGLDTAATRDGARLMIQNDIGTNDAHVLVIEVDTGGARSVTSLTYSDLHRQRFAFFQRLLGEVGASWSEPQARQNVELNEGRSYWVGTARFEASGEAELLAQLEGIGERIVFLIDWNRARKRLLPFVSKTGAVSVLDEAARHRSGHCAWLTAGGDRLVWRAMSEQGGLFRLGDRLDDVLGAEPAREFLVEVLALASRAAQARQPASLVEDEVRALLARCLQGHRGEFELLQEHAALSHALAQGLRDALAHGAERDPAAAARLAARAKTWERQADHLVMQAREQAERQLSTQAAASPPVRLIERADDVADALEEACFVLSLLAEHFAAAPAKHAPAPGWGNGVRDAMQALADSVLTATQDHVKAVAIARTLGDGSDAHDHDEFLAALWRVLQAERQCDELLRGARRALGEDARQHRDPVALTWGNEFAAAIEQASDALLALGHGLRELAFQHIQPGRA